MSWIKDNKFAAMLGGGTLLVAIVLFYLGIVYHGHYAKALENYLSDADEVTGFEAIPLYPSKENRAGKTKALNEYRTSIGGLQTAFDKFRPKDLKNIAPQGFTDHAKAANTEITAAFEKAGTKLPEGFFIGFEPYTTSLAREEATGLLDYQLGATKELLLALAKAAPSQLQNLYRAKFPEEDGEKWEANPTDAARSFPMEITFKGTERALRDFLSTIVKSPNYFFVVRSVRILNEKQSAPRAADAKFEATPAAAGAGAKPAAADPFVDFLIPGDETPAPAPPAGTPGTAPKTPPGTAPKPATPTAPKPATATATATAPAAAATAPKPAPAGAAAPGAARIDSSRILNRVLGAEELEVFLHIDVLEFLPVKALPEVPKSQP